MRPSGIYNLGAQSHVRVSFDTPEYTAQVDALETLRLLDPRQRARARHAVLSGVELGVLRQGARDPQRETTPFHPRSPYATAKVFAYLTTVNYREAYGLHASNGILFNHESPRRGETFVTRKVTRAVARIVAGRQSKLYLGNLDARRDWGYAKDYVVAMWKMLQMPSPDDYVIATREAHSVRELLELAFGLVGEIGGSTSSSTRATSARPRSISSSATRARPGRCWAFSPPSDSAS